RVLVTREDPLLVGGAVEQRAEDTGPIRRLILVGLDVFHPPGAPQAVHRDQPTDSDCSSARLRASSSSACTMWSNARPGISSPPRFRTVNVPASRSRSPTTIT